MNNQQTILDSEPLQKEENEFTLFCDITWGGYSYDVKNGYLRELQDTFSGTQIRRQIMLTPYLVKKLGKIKAEYSSFDVKRIEKIDSLLEENSRCGDYSIEDYRSMFKS